MSDMALRDLTPRQREVLELVAEGMTDKEIAGRLSTSGRTIRSHMNNILAKLDVRTRTAAAIIYQNESSSPANEKVARLQKKYHDLQDEFAYLKIIFGKFAEHLAEVI